MRLDLSELARHKDAQIIHTVEEKIAPQRFSVPILSPAKGILRIVNTGKELWVTGTVEARVRLTCSRCLKEFEKDIVVDIDERFPLRLSRSTPPEQRDDCLDGLVPIWEDEVFDVGEFIRQNLEAALPLAPLCSPDCKGICPHCGKDLNEGPCECKEETVDPRLRELLKIREKLRRKEGG